MKKIKIAILSLAATISLFAQESNQVNRDGLLTDYDYVQGMMYLEGKKGVNKILKEINNCPYDTCKKSNITGADVTGKITIEIAKPDYKKALEHLEKSVDNYNFLAADKIVAFLIRRLDYKSKYGNEYLEELLKEETGLNREDYMRVLRKSFINGTSGKGCVAPYYHGQFLENGYMDFEKNLKEALLNYKTALANCPKGNYIKMLSEYSIQRLEK